MFLSIVLACVPSPSDPPGGSPDATQAPQANQQSRPPAPALAQIEVSIQKGDEAPVRVRSESFDEAGNPHHTRIFTNGAISGVHRYVYSDAGLLVTESDGETEHRYTYDDAGRMVGDAWKTGEDGFYKTYRFDKTHGDLVKVIEQKANGELLKADTITYERGEDSLVFSQNTSRKTATADGPYSYIIFSRNPAGHVTSKVAVYPNENRREAFTYAVDAHGNIIEESWATPEEREIAHVYRSFNAFGEVVSEEYQECDKGTCTQSRLEQWTYDKYGTMLTHSTRDASGVTTKISRELAYRD